MEENSEKACSIPCDSEIINKKRCLCVNGARSLDKAATIGSVTVNFHFCSREERNELIEYLDKQCWDYAEESIFTKENAES